LGLSHGPPSQANHGRAIIYAIIRAGGKQYRVQPEQTIDIDRVAADAGATVEFHEVLLVGGDGDTLLGTPFVEGARVVAEVVDQGRGKKILVFKYKNKTRYRRRRGHRQAYTRLAIRQILTDGKASAHDAEEKPARATRRRAAPKAKQDIEAAVVATPESSDVPVSMAETSDPEAATGTGALPAEAVPAPQGEVKPARRARTKKPIAESD
jgi:large subunit ribosomal protein L21